MKLLPVIVLSIACSLSAAAQVCEPEWLPGFGTTGVGGSVQAMATFDPDGDGPSSAQLVVGGSFSSAGSRLASGVAIWDGSTWESLGEGVSGIVRALLVLEEEAGAAIYAAGTFSDAGGIPATNIAKWNGTDWTPVDAGLGIDVHALEVFDDGDGHALYAAGTTIGRDRGDHSIVAKWDGQSWTPVGSNLEGVVECMAVFDDGSGPLLYAGGMFGVDGGQIDANVARFVGGQWESIADAGFANGAVLDLKVLTDQSGPAIYAAGTFCDTHCYIARWRNDQWTSVGGGLNNEVESLVVFDDGNGPSLYAGGYFFFGESDVQRWDPNSDLWIDVGSAESSFYPLAVYGSGTDSTLVSGNGGSVLQWDGSVWAAIDAESDETIDGILITAIHASRISENTLYVGGQFSKIGGTLAQDVARWDGASWQSVGEPPSGGQIVALEEFDDGDGLALYAGGFTFDNGTALAKWDGTWSPVGSGLSGSVQSLLVADFDDGSGPALYVGGTFPYFSNGRILKRQNNAWHTLGSGIDGGILPEVRSLAFSENFSGGGAALFAAGSFLNAGGMAANNIAKWNGATWEPLGAGVNGSVRAIALFDDGAGEALYAGGSFTVAGGVGAQHIAKWNGTDWEPLAGGVDGPVWALHSTSIDGESQLIVSGAFENAGEIAAQRIASWDGADWTAIGAGLGQLARALDTFDPDGPSGPAAPRLVVGGNFTTAGDRVSAYFAQFGEDTNTWGQPTGGDFDVGSNWLCDRALSSFDNFVIDGTVAGYTFANYGIALPGDPEPLRALTMRARTDVVSPFNLAGQSLEITGGTSTIARPALTVGELPDLGAQLTIRNITATPASVSAASLTIADQPTMPGVASLLGVRDANSVLDIAGDAYIGRRGDSGELLVQSGATASLGGVISVGTETGAGGLVRVLGTGSTLLHSAQNRSMAIGQSGEGALVIGSGGSAQSLGRLDTLILGTNPSGVGSVEIAGASSSWSFDSNRFIVGNRGAGSVLIRNGALLQTDSDFSVDLALQPGSTGVVELRDAGSRWIETGQSVTVHEGGQLIIGDGATLAAPAINIRSGGTLEGDGAIGVGFFDAEVINLGDVAPRTENGDPATLTIQGDFRQLDALPGQPADRAGRLRLTLSETAASSISVQGIADVRGGLIIDAPQGVMLNDAADLSFLNANFGVDGRFDVVFLAGQPRNDKGELLALAVQYPTTRGSERGFGDTLSLTTIATVAIDVQGAVTQIDSTGLITDGALADLNGDGLNDLALTVVDGADPENSPGSVVILFNGGDNAGEWQGFTSSASYTVGANPSSIAAADLDNDTFNDLVVTNAGDDTATLLAYAGGGSFAPSQLTLTGTTPSAVILQDLDGDSRTDVAIAAQGDDTVTVYLNNGGVGGAWLGVTPQTPVAVGDAPVDLASVDNDDDKDLDDIASIYAADNELELLDNDGGGNLTAGQTIPVGLAPRFLLTADLDNDPAQSLDLITADSGGDTISVILDEPGPDVAPSVQIPLGFTPRFIAAADLDSDGDRDLAILAASGAPANEIAVLRNDLTSEGDLVLAQDDPIVLDAPIRFLIAGDIDNDGADDLIAITESSLRGDEDQVVRFLLPCPGDANGDRVVDFSDLNAVLVGFGFAGALEGDVTGDGLVDFSDLNAVLVAFGSNCLN